VIAIGLERSAVARLGEVAGALDITVGDVVPEAMQRDLLHLTDDIAHRVVRVTVPLTSYLIGVAVGRGATPEAGEASGAGVQVCAMCKTLCFVE